MGNFVAVAKLFCRKSSPIRGAVFSRSKLVWESLRRKLPHRDYFGPQCSGIYPNNPPCRVESKLPLLSYVETPSSPND